MMTMTMMTMTVTRRMMMTMTMMQSNVDCPAGLRPICQPTSGIALTPPSHHHHHHHHHCPHHRHHHPENHHHWNEKYDIRRGVTSCLCFKFYLNWSQNRPGDKAALCNQISSIDFLLIKFYNTIIVNLIWLDLIHFQFNWSQNRPGEKHIAGAEFLVSWKWPRATLSASFGLFLERNHPFRVFLVSQFFTKWLRICPSDISPCRKKNYTSGKNGRGTVKFVNSFILALSVIFTQPVWKCMYLGF